MDFANPDPIVVGPTPPIEHATVAWVMKPAPTPARTLNRVGRGGARELQITRVAEGEPVRLVYGAPRVGGLIVNALVHGSSIVVQVLWALASDAVTNVTLNDAALPAGSSATHYTGSQVAADATLVAAFAAQSPPITYADVLPGLCYSVLVLPITAVTGALNLNAVVRGRRVYDPRDPGQDPDDAGTWAWSDNPSLALADFLASAEYGAAKAVDWASVETAADANDTALAGGEPQRRIDWALDGVQPVAAVADTLRTYAGAFLSNRGGTFFLVPDAPAASVATYSHAAGQIVRWSDWTKRDAGNAPSVIEVAFTETAQIPHRERVVPAALPGAGSTRPRRVSRVALPGITRYSQAWREAVERLNKLSVEDLSLTLTVFDPALAHEPGDVVTVTLPTGLTGKLMRLTAPPEAAGPGLWTLALAEYDPAAYSSEVVTAPTYADTSLADPNAPPAPAAVAAAEEVYQLDNGVYASRARITITAPDYPWTAGYRVEVLAAGTLIDAGTTVQPGYATPALQEGVAYTLRAQVLSVTGAGGSWASTSLTPAGKYLPPGDVPSLSGFEVGGDVYLSWAAAVDLDIWRYEIRYGSTGGTWDTAALVDRIDGLRAVIRGAIPAGTWKFWIKAIDSVRQYSANAASVTLTVTLDPDALATGAAFSSPTLTAMSAFARTRGGATLWITDPDAAGDKFGALFTAALGTYVNPLADYHTSATSVWQSEVFDFGQDVTGDWSVDAAYTMLSGTVTLTLQLASATAYPTFTDHTALPVKQTARYVRVKLEATATETLLVESVAVAVAAVTRKEFGTITCAATGTDTVTLDGVYSARRRIVLTPIEVAAARIATADNITFGTPSSFDVYLFNDSGSRVAGDVAWAFEGI